MKLTLSITGNFTRSFLLAISLFVIFSASAQRPKVGLVLSGGGAKGISHIGIVQAIDSAGLKIDYVTGTSMGSVIGSLYSVGYSGKQIEKEVDRIDWAVLLSNKPDYKVISIDEKDEYGNYSAEIGVKKFKPQIATGLIESEELWLKLNELFLPVHDIKDFSKFNIPFKCISTDLANGNAIVHSDGEIVKAVRASMAIPSVFTAVNTDSTKLVDGGIIRNFPVSDIRDMGADIVIGVNLFKGLPDITKLNSALDVFYQITQYRDAEDLLKQKEICDILIEPPVDQYSAGSFSASDDIMKIGKEVGKLYYPYFKRLADSLNKLYPIEYNPENRLPNVSTIIIDEIEFIGLDKTSKSLLMDKLNIRPGEQYTSDDINKGFRRAFSSRYYDVVYYELKPTSPGHVKMVCIVREALMTQIKAGLSFHSYSGAAIIANVTVRNLLLDKSRTLVKVAIGDYFRLYGEHRQAFGRKANDFINFSVATENLPLNIYEKEKITSLYNVTYAKADVNYTHVFGTDWSMALGANLQRDFFNPEVADELRVDGNYHFAYAYMKIEAKTTERRFFPTRGSEFVVEGGAVFDRRATINLYVADNSIIDTSEWVDGQPEYYRFKLNFTRYNSLSNRMTLFYNTQLGLTLNSQGFIFDNYYLGGVQQLFRQQMIFVGLNEGQITTSAAAAGLLGFQYNIAGELFLIGRANGVLYNFSTETKIYDKELIEELSGFSLGVGYNLGVLPMEFNAMYAPEIGELYTHVRIGFLF